MSKRQLLVLLVLAPLSASAQAFSADQHILLSEGTLRGSPRIMGLAGAWTGLAEGAEGIPRNPAAPAMRDAKFASDFSWDVGGTMHFLFPWSTKDQDWDNDGSPDQASAATRDFLGSQVLYSFAALRYKMVGFGAGFDIQNFLSKQQLPGEGFERYHNLALTHVFGVVSARFWRDQLAVGLGIESTHAFIGYGEQPMGNFLPTPKDSMGFHGWGFLMGGVYRPEDGNWRVGFSYKPALVAHPFRGRTDIGGLTAPSGVDVPGRLMLGGALALGSGRALASGAISGAVGGVVERGIETGSAAKAFEPKAIITDAAVGAVTAGLIKAGSKPVAKIVGAVKNRLGGAATTVVEDLSHVCNGSTCGVPGCFVAGTLVLRASGESVPIETVRAGDIVLAADETSGWQQQPRRVLEAYEREVEVLIDLVVESGGRHELITTTTEHPFLVEADGARSWRAAGELRDGVLLVTTSGSAKVEQVAFRREATRVFNLNVEAEHTYFVGETESLVHNAGCAPGGTAKPSGLTAEQARNLKRFEAKLPSGAGPTSIHELPGGGKGFQAEVPGKVPGSKAIYEKQVGPAGETLQYTKTTVDPAGEIVHVKDKINGTVLTP